MKGTNKMKNNIIRAAALAAAACLSLSSCAEAKKSSDTEQPKPTAVSAENIPETAEELLDGSYKTIN